MNNRSGNALVIALVVLGLVVLLAAIGGGYFLLKTSTPEELAPKTSMTPESPSPSPTAADLSEIEADVDTLKVDDSSEDFTSEDTAGL